MMLRQADGVTLRRALREAGAGRRSPPEVYVADVVQKDVPVYLELVGQTQGFQDVEIRARVEGFLETVNFREGSLVRKGDLLYEIDRKPLEATLAGAKADQATAEARLEKANNDVARYTPLVAKQAVSQQELDDARRRAGRRDGAGRGRQGGSRKSDARPGYTRVTSPINGLVGTTQVKPGNLVGRGRDTLLTTISQIDPMLFRVGVTEADYLRVARRDRRGPATPAGRRHPAHAGRRQRLPAHRQGELGRSRRRSHDRHAGHPAGVSQPRAAAAAGPVRAGRGCCSKPRRARCWCRSGPCRNCRTSTAWPSSTRAAKWRFAT